MTCRPAPNSGKSNPWAAPGIDDELDHARRLPLRQRRAVCRGRHVVLVADEDQGRDGERRVRFVGAWGIEGRGGLEGAATPGWGSGKLERGVAALRGADRGDPRGVDKGLASEKAERAIGVGDALLKSTAQVSFRPRVEKSSTNSAT